jgi:muramoyltetrapeptide carboxypeptidase
MIAQASNPEHAVAVNLVCAIINNQLPQYVFYSDKNNRKGSVKAPITGGNLTLITSTLGTDTEIITDNKILFIEEIGEAAYRIDRMLVQLKRANKLKKITNEFTNIFLLDSTVNEFYTKQII